MLTTLASLLFLPALPPEPMPPCPPSIDRCASLRLWIAPHDDDAFDDHAFVATQLEHANLHHQPAGLAFAIVETRTLTPAERAIVSRADRDALGHANWRRGVIDVYLVSSLANVDEPGEIRGVHWRSRADRKRRFIIVSRISPPHVLAHELGHYFGLPHSDAPASLMNTSANALPERAFLPDEITRITRRARALFSSGLVADPRQGPP